MTLYCWGANSHGQLGLGNKTEEELEPKQVNLSHCDLKAENIIAIAGGAGHTLILDNIGKVYSCGSNKKGQLGSNDDVCKFTEIDILGNKKVVHISCGWDFSAAVTEDGKLFVWGNNTFTQLGLSKSITCTGIPSMLQVSQKLATGFKETSCGLRHTAIITSSRELLVAGTGKKGQLGLGDNYNDDNYLSICKVPEIEDVASAACGEHHTVCLKDDGTVLAWGDNKYGQLGLDPVNDSSFVPVEAFKNDTAQKVYAGWSHTSVLCKNGTVYTWGRNSYGQLGAPRDTPHKPEKLAGLPEVAQLSVGSEHSLVVTADGRLLAWGWNEHGACGNKSKENVVTPSPVFADNRKVKLAYACTGSSFAVVE